MKRRLLAALGAATLSAAVGGVVLAQNTGVNPVVGSVWTYLGATYGAGWVVPSALSSGYMATNAALAVATLTTTQVYRAGFYAPGDGGAMRYTHQAAPCSLAGGVGDNGSQVKAADGGCWIADFSGTQPTPLVWGAKGDATTDDRVQVQAAIDALAGRTLYLGGKRYCIGGVGLVANATISIQGDAAGYPWNNDHPNWGFVACAINQNTLTFSGAAASGSKLGGVYFDASRFTNTAGAAITLNNAVQFVSIKNVGIYFPCTGIDIRSGSQHQVEHAIIGAGGATHGCGGVTIGRDTVAAGTVEVRLDAVTSYGSSDWGIMVLDAGGLQIHNADLLFADRGLAIAPGTNQAVFWLFADNSALGDTTCQEGIFIDPAASGAVAVGLVFNGTWTSSAGGANPSCLGPGVSVQNTHGGLVKGVHFLGHRSYNNTREGFVIQSNVYDVTIDSSMICSNSVQTNTVPANHYDGVAIGAGAAGIALRNNRISPYCSATGALPNNQLTAIQLYGGNFNLMITGNDLHDSTNPLMLTGATPVGPNVIKDNLGVDDAVAGVAAVSPLPLGLYPMIALTGATATINATSGGSWNNREMTILARDATQNFVAGTGARKVCNTRTLTAGQVAKAMYFGGSDCLYIFPP